jgi:Hint domain
MVAASKLPVQTGLPAADLTQAMFGTGITVLADGTVTVVNEGDKTPGEANFSHEVTNAQGLTGVGFVKGASIDTLQGPIAVEALAPGDMVLTRDHGYQPVRWSGNTTVASAGELAAVVIPAGTLCNHADLRVSPQHRLLLTGWRAELHSGEHEVLVKAIHLVHCGLLRQDRSVRPVTYCQLMFDRHEIIRANGMWSESCYPDPEALRHLDPEGFDAIIRLFPALAGDHPGPALARMEVPRRVAGLLVGGA